MFSSAIAVLVAVCLSLQPHTDAGGAAGAGSGGTAHGKICVKFKLSRCLTEDCLILWKRYSPTHS